MDDTIHNIKLSIVSLLQPALLVYTVNDEMMGYRLKQRCKRCYGANSIHRAARSTEVKIFLENII